MPRAETAGKAVCGAEEDYECLSLGLEATSSEPAQPFRRQMQEGVAE